MGGVLWSLKETSLLSRLYKEFKAEDVVDMMNYWIETNNVSNAANFGFFYTRRYVILDEIKPKEYEWD